MKTNEEILFFLLTEMTPLHFLLKIKLRNVNNKY
jgi:hypothetical protein